jgi:hypothetical protein
MATLLDAVNEVLKKTGLIAGDAGELQSLTDSARQRGIDLAIQSIGEGVDELFTACGIAQPKQQAEGTLTLQTNVRAYELPDELVRLRFPLIDKTNSQYVLEFPGGYNALLIYDPKQDFAGLPYYACIRPTDGWLYFDRTPTSAENGRVYTYQYDKDLTLDEATDVFPFNATVFRAMISPWAQLWKREMRGASEFDSALFTKNIARAARLLRMRPARKSYSPRRGMGA